MVSLKLLFTAEMRKAATLEPNSGINDPEFTFYMKLKCQNCGEETKNFSCVCLNDEVRIPIPKKSKGRRSPGVGRGVANLVQKCKLCERVNTITLVPVPQHASSPLTKFDGATNKYVPLIGLECQGVVPVDNYFMGPQWKVEAVTSGPVFKDVDLQSGYWARFDHEKGRRLVEIYNPKWKFEMVKGWNC